MNNAISMRHVQFIAMYNYQSLQAKIMLRISKLLQHDISRQAWVYTEENAAHWQNWGTSARIILTLVTYHQIWQSLRVLCSIECCTCRINYRASYGVIPQVHAHWKKDLYQRGIQCQSYNGHLSCLKSRAWQELELTWVSSANPPYCWYSTPPFPAIDPSSMFPL